MEADHLPAAAAVAVAGTACGRRGNVQAAQNHSGDLAPAPCHASPARPAAVCRLSLLPAQDLCVPERQVVGWFQIEREQPSGAPLTLPAVRTPCGAACAAAALAIPLPPWACRPLPHRFQVGVNHACALCPLCLCLCVCMSSHRPCAAASARPHFSPERFPVFVIEESPGGAAYYGFPEHGDLPGTCAAPLYTHPTLHAAMTAHRPRWGRTAVRVTPLPAVPLLPQPF